MGGQPLLRSRQGVQQKRQGDRGGELRAGGKRVRSIPEQRAAAVAGEHERGDVAAVCASAASYNAGRVGEVDAVAAPAVGHRVDRQRHDVRQLRSIIPRPREMRTLHLHAMGRALRRSSPPSPALRMLRIEFGGYARHDDWCLRGI